MPETQPQSAGVDKRGNPVPMVAGEYGDVVTLDLDTASGVPIKLSDATGYPENPTVLFWILSNPNQANGAVAHVSGAGLVAGKGLLLDRASSGAVAVPGVLGLRTDPGKTFVVQSSGGPLTYLLTLLGKNLEAP